LEFLDKKTFHILAYSVTPMVDSDVMTGVVALLSQSAALDDAAWGQNRPWITNAPVADWKG
jgi:hypothetical protein